MGSEGCDILINCLLATLATFSIVGSEVTLQMGRKMTMAKVAQAVNQYGENAQRAAAKGSCGWQNLQLLLVWSAITASNANIRKITDYCHSEKFKTSNISKLRLMLTIKRLED